MINNSNYKQNTKILRKTRNLINFKRVIFNFSKNFLWFFMVNKIGLQFKSIKK
jgi:hypothetical protein